MKKKIIGFRLLGAGLNDKGPLESMISDERHRFGNVYDTNHLCHKFKISGRFTKYDYIQTYDGYDVVSDAFKKFCEENNYKALSFVQFPNCPAFYWMKVENVLLFDSQKRGTRFLNYSTMFNGYEEVIGASPVTLKSSEILLDGIFRTDMFFGTGERKHPLVVVGIDTKRKIKEAGFKGILFEEISETP